MKNKFLILITVITQFFAFSCGSDKSNSKIMVTNWESEESVVAALQGKWNTNSIRKHSSELITSGKDFDLRIEIEGNNITTWLKSLGSNSWGAPETKSFHLKELRKKSENSLMQHEYIWYFETSDEQQITLYYDGTSTELVYNAWVLYKGWD